MKKVVIAALSLIVIISLVSTANATLLGVAGDYNAFIFGDMTTRYTDSQGRVAVGGNITATNFTVGDGPILPSGQYSLVSGGNVSYQSASMFNGGVYAGGNVYLDHHTIIGDITANSSITLGPGGGTVTGSMTQYAATGSPIDFTEAKNYLVGVSTGLSTMAPNGDLDFFHYSSGTQFFLHGTDPVSIFNLDGDDLNLAKVLLFDLEPDQIAIINVSGSSIDLHGFGPGQWSGTSTPWEGKQQNILFNFYEATSLSIHNIGWKGSLLAPYADTIFYSAHIDGTLIANSITWENTAGSPGGEYHYYPFDNNLEEELPKPVPEPASVLLFGTGLVGLAARLRRKPQNLL